MPIRFKAGSCPGRELVITGEKMKPTNFFRLIGKNIRKKEKITRVPEFKPGDLSEEHYSVNSILLFITWPTAYYLEILFLKLALHHRILLKLSNIFIHFLKRLSRSRVDTRYFELMRLRLGNLISVFMATAYNIDFLGMWLFYRVYSLGNRVHFGLSNISDWDNRLTAKAVYFFYRLPRYISETGMESDTRVNKI